MNDQMRAEFETWADAKCLPLTRINWKDGSVSEYAYTATFDAWQVWQAAYAAGRKAEREATVKESLTVQKEALQQLADEAQELDMGY